MCTCAATTDNSYDARAMRARSTRSCSTATLVEQLLLDGRLRNSGNARSIAFRGAVRNERKCAFDDISAHWLPTSSPSCQSIAALGNNTLGPLRHHRETAQSKKARGSQHMSYCYGRLHLYRYRTTCHTLATAAPASAPPPTSAPPLYVCLLDIV